MLLFNSIYSTRSQVQIIKGNSLHKSYKLRVMDPIPMRSISSSKSDSRSNDLLADALSRIRNGYFRSFQDVVVVDSKEIRELLNALIHAGYINNWDTTCSGRMNFINKTEDCSQVSKSKIASSSLGEPVWGVDPLTGVSIKVSLKYFQNIPAMRGMQQISSPGKRTYMSKKRILKYSEEQNWGENKTLFLLTPQGIMNHREIVSQTGSKSKIASLACSGRAVPLDAGFTNYISEPQGGEALCLIW